MPGCVCPMDPKKALPISQKICERDPYITRKIFGNNKIFKNHPHIPTDSLKHIFEY